MAKVVTKLMLPGNTPLVILEPHLFLEVGDA
jgi:hypothetical protein